MQTKRIVKNATAARIKQELDRQGIKHSWLAEQLAIDRSTLSRYVNGQSNIPRTKHRKIAELLRVDVKDLFSEYSRYMANANKESGGNDG